MTIGADDLVFIDTNVLVYVSIAESPFHDSAQTALEIMAGGGRELCISRQILREYLATLTRPQVFTPAIPVSSLLEEVQHFQRRFRVVEDGAEVTRHLLQLMERVPIGGRQVHDANIVATMQVHGIGRLLTGNVRDFSRFSHLITVIPLEAA